MTGNGGRRRAEVLGTRPPAARRGRPQGPPGPRAPGPAVDGGALRAGVPGVLAQADGGVLGVHGRGAGARRWRRSTPATTRSTCCWRSRSASFVASGTFSRHTLSRLRVALVAAAARSFAGARGRPAARGARTSPAGCRRRSVVCRLVGMPGPGAGAASCRQGVRSRCRSRRSSSAAAASAFPAVAGRGAAAAGVLRQVGALAAGGRGARLPAPGARRGGALVAGLARRDDAVGARARPPRRRGRAAAGVPLRRRPARHPLEADRAPAAVHRHGAARALRCRRASSRSTASCRAAATPSAAARASRTW